MLKFNPTGNSTVSDPLWTAPASAPVIGAKEAHIWRMDVDSFLNWESLKSLLSVNERIRMERYCFEKDQKQFTIGRGMLRIILGWYMNLPPEKVEFSYGAFGKPALVDLWSPFRFNVSHSKNVVLIAVTREKEIGIDVEYVQDGFPYEGISQHVFDAGELRKLVSLPADERNSAFFELWTRKEALLKAEGRSMDSLYYSSLKQWALHSFLIHKECESYAGAVAVEGNSWQFSYWRWQNGGEQ